MPSPSALGVHRPQWSVESVASCRVARQALVRATPPPSLLRQKPPRLGFGGRICFRRFSRASEQMANESAEPCSRVNGEAFMQGRRRGVTERYSIHHLSDVGLNPEPSLHCMTRNVLCVRLDPSLDPSLPRSANVRHLSVRLCQPRERQVFEPLCAGFTDAAPALRELTLKSMVAFTSRLSEKNMNERLIKHLARLQVTAGDGEVWEGDGRVAGGGEGGCRTCTRRPALGGVIGGCVWSARESIA